MTTPAKILKKPDTDLTELDDAEIAKLAGGVVKRTIKLALEASDEPSAGWNEPIGAFLKVAAHIGLKHPLVATAMVGVLEKDAPAGAVSVLVELATQNSDEVVRDFLKLLRGELLSGEEGRADAFKAKTKELEDTLQGR